MRHARSAAGPIHPLPTQAWLPVFLLPALAWFVFADRAPWAAMWALAAALGIGFKWLTFFDAVRSGCRPAPTRILAYFVAWPGMNARAFFGVGAKIQAPGLGELGCALGKTLLGIAFVWLLAPAMLDTLPIAAGWIGMAGMALGLHFGSFHLLSVAWRSAGVDASPIMRAPMMATSLAEFWGQRWNHAFSELAEKFIFRPVARKHGLIPATCFVYLASGLVHELVISLPAGGGYGLPTSYFLIQALGVLVERTDTARRLGLGRGWRGWLFTLAITAAPVFWLFHPLFIYQVIVPFLHAMGAS